MQQPFKEIPHHQRKREWAEKERAEAQQLADADREQKAAAKEQTETWIKWMGALATLFGLVGVIWGVISWNSERPDRERERALSRLAYIEQRAKMLASGEREELVESPALREVIEVLAENGDPIELQATKRIVLRDMDLPCGRYLFRAPQVYLYNVTINGSVLEAESDRFHVAESKVRGSHLIFVRAGRPSEAIPQVDPSRPIAPIMLTNSQLENSTFRFRIEATSIRQTKFSRTKLVLDSPGRDYVLDLANYTMTTPLYPNTLPDENGVVRGTGIGFFKHLPDLTPGKKDLPVAAPLFDGLNKICKPLANQGGYRCEDTSKITPLSVVNKPSASRCNRPEEPAY